MDETYKIMDFQSERVSDFINSRSLRFRKVADIIAKSNGRVIFCPHLHMNQLIQ